MSNPKEAGSVATGHVDRPEPQHHSGEVVRQVRHTVTILIPAYNEQEVLPLLHERLCAVAGSTPSHDFEFLFVNDGSTDNTMDLIKELAMKDPRVSFVNLSRNFGKEVAMIAGIDHVNGDAMVIIDADLQDPPELIPEMIRLWEEEDYDDVYARRSSRAGESWLKKKTSKWFYRVLARSTRIPIQTDTGDFRLMSRRAVEALRKFREAERYTKGMYSWIGYRKKEIAYNRDPRAAGTTKWNYGRLMNLAIEGITSFTTAPLRLSTFVGAVVSALAFLYTVFIVARTIFGYNDLAGYPSMLAIIMFLGGIQLLSLGVIGEYIARIFTETKKRPLYFVDEYHGDAIRDGNAFEDQG